MAKKLKTFEGFWILKSFWHALTHAIPLDYDPFKPLKNKAPVPRSHFYKIETGKGKRFNDNKKTIKICSWNVFYGLNKNEIIREIKTNSYLKDVDVFLLQEAPRFFSNKKENFSKILMKKTGYNYVYAVLTVNLDSSGNPVKDIGNLILSKYPILKSKIFRLKTLKGRWDFDPYDPNFGNRLALLATLRTHNGNIDIANIHLDTMVLKSKRGEQLREFLEDLKKVGHLHRIIIGGDFNTVEGKEKIVRNVIENEGYDNIFGKNFIRTHNFVIPMHTDHIYFKNIKLLNSRVLREVKCSDHYPIVAEFSL